MVFRLEVRTSTARGCWSTTSAPGPASVNKKAIKTAFNQRVSELKKLIELQVEAIALDFSSHGTHYSKNQIRSQVHYRMAKPKKSRKPMLANAWAHAQAEARRLKGTSHQFI